MKTYSSFDEYWRHRLDVTLGMCNNGEFESKFAWQAAQASMESENKKLKERLTAADKVVEAANEVFKLDMDISNPQKSHLWTMIRDYDNLTSNK